MAARKPQQPAITVKSASNAGGVRVHWIVRVDGVNVAALGPSEDDKRRALRYRDRLLAHWKAWARNPHRMHGERWDHGAVEV